MRRILLLENKAERQKIITFNLKEYNFLDNILGDEECNIFLDDFLENQFYFDIYDTIIIHESIYHESKREQLFKTLHDYCKTKNIIKFSGNNTQFSLENEKSLQINPTMLYRNLKIYLEMYANDDANILILALGEKWKLNILLNTLEKLNIFIEDNTKYPVQKSIFSSNVGLTKIKEVSENYYNKIFENIDKNNLSIDDIETININLNTLIKEIVNE